jgi:septal ring-binding cell division protein DamX
MFNLAAHLNSENSTISQLQEAWQLADSAVKAGNEDSVVLIELIEQKIAAYDSRVDEDISEQVPAARDPAMNLDTEWLMSLSPESYTIQLVSLSSLENVDKFINQSGLQNTARHFPTQLKAGLIHIIVYGEYGSKADATRALIDLPDHLRKIGPYVRKIEVLQRDFSDNKP